MLAVVQTEPVRIRWGLGDFAWAWPAIIVGQVVLGALALAARGFGANHRADAIDIAIITTGSAGVTVGVLAALAALKGRRSLTADFGLAFRVRDWPWLAVGVVMQLVATGAVEIINSVAGTTQKQDVARALQHSGTAGRILGAVAVVTCAPFAEELLFRGLLLRGLLRRMGAASSVVVCGGLFAAAHLIDPGAAALLAPLAMVGVVSAVRAVRTGELSQSILLHAGFNLLSAILLIQG
jgi:Predicted metal-dependent membrane protease